MSESALTDAEWIAQFAQHALDARRYRLASELTRLAARAQDFERRQALAAAEDLRLVPVIGTTRDETPTAGRPPHHLRPVDALTDTVVAGNGSHAPSTCATALPDGVCAALIGWSDGFTGARKGWYHLDQTITGHTAIPTLEAIENMERHRTDATRTDLRVADWVAGQQ